MLVPFLRDLAILLTLGVVVVLLFHRLRLPAIVGFLLAGIIAGPHGLGIIGHVEGVESLAEVGVIVLMFTIGLEFSLNELKRIRTIALTAGTVQVGATIAVIAALSVALLGVTLAEGIFAGMIVALSSTAIVLKILGDRGEISTPHGRIAVAILIFQDLCIVPMMLVTPLLAGGTTEWTRIALVLGQAFLIILLAVLLARRVVPRLLHLAAEMRSREVFVLTVVLVCLGIAWLSQRVGLSLALGAFIAGMVISESEYSHRALGEVLPFRDTLASVFFLSAGMLLDLGAVLVDPAFIFGFALAIIVLKALIAGVAVLLLLRYPLRVAVVAGLGLAQMGEFSFVLAAVGVGLGLIPEHLRQPFLASTVLSMVATPFLIAGGVRLAARIARRHADSRGRADATVLTQAPAHLGDHTIIIGFGLNGRNLARVLDDADIRHVIVEMNAQTVAAERQRGVPIVYGDACQAAVLEGVGVRRARVIVIAISDAAATRRITEIARRLNPQAEIIVRTRYVQEVEVLAVAGASEVVPEEFETSIEIFSRVLRNYMVPGDVIEELSEAIRQDAYVMLRYRDVPGVSLLGNMAGIKTEIVRVQDESPVAGLTLAESQIRSRTGAAVVAVKRGDEAISNPPPDTRLEAGDVVLILGTKEQVTAGEALLRGAVAGG